MTKFLKQIEQAEKTPCGLSIFRDFCADCVDDFDAEDFPWNTSPKLFGQKLPQHAYLYARTSNERNKYPILEKLESLCETIEAGFDGRVTSVFCNRFQDPTHHIPWHKDAYGSHIFVLSFGADRVIEFRDNRTQQVEAIHPHAGDLYFMKLSLNATHQHRVLAASDDTRTRISFVFFFDPPKYAKDYRISRMQRIKGAWNGLIESANA